MKHMIERLGSEMSVVLSTTIVRLFVAAILGGVIGLERQIRHKPAGLRTNMFICFGAAMFTVLSDQLAGGHAGENTRIAAQIIPGIGFIGAGSILHSRGSVTGLTTAATLFVIASVGMAVGGGLYITAVFATGLLLIALAVLGRMEARYDLKSMLMTYEVVGREVDAMLSEVSRILEAEQFKMQSLHVVRNDEITRLVFSVDATVDDQKNLKIRLHQSSAFTSVLPVGVADHE